MRYEKGQKDATRRRTIAVASERFRSDGIAASGLAGIMNDAGLTNGAFYPHFRSKAELVRESVSATLDDQANQFHDSLSKGGLEAVIATYLSPAHRDSPGNGCAVAALLPELARQPSKSRNLYVERFATMVREIASALPPRTPNKESVALGIYATLIGTLQLARAAKGVEFSDRILAAGADAARAMLRPREGKGRKDARRRMLSFP